MLATNSTNVDVIRRVCSCMCLQRIYIYNGKSFCRLYNNVDHWESDYHMVLLTVSLSLNMTVISFSAPSYVEPTCIHKYPTESPEAESKNSKGIPCCFPRGCSGWGICCN